MSKVTRGALTACALAAAAYGFPASAQTFTADEGSVTGTPAHTVTADRISFTYEAMINQSNDGGPLNGDAFTESGFLNKASFANGGSAVASYLNAVGGYGIYGLFNIAGTSTVTAGEIHATFTSATLSLYIDPGQDTTFGFAANLATTGGATGDDYVIANYTLQEGEAFVRSSLAAGDFDSILNMTLTPAGQAFFVSPAPFYSLEGFGGQTESITGASFTEPFIAHAKGAGTEIFMAPIPEPETYALMLAGLGALGFVARRRRRS